MKSNRNITAHLSFYRVHLSLIRSNYVNNCNCLCKLVAGCCPQGGYIGKFGNAICGGSLRGIWGTHSSLCQGQRRGAGQPRGLRPFVPPFLFLRKEKRRYPSKRNAKGGFRVSPFGNPLEATQDGRARPPCVFPPGSRSRSRLRSAGRSAVAVRSAPGTLRRFHAR